MRFTFSYLFLLCFIPLFLPAQDIQLKKKEVLADGQKVMTFKRLAWGNAVHLQCLDHEKDILCIEFYGKRPPLSLPSTAAVKIEFLGKDLKLVSQRRLSREAWLTMMAQMDVFDEDWEVVEENARAFVERYKEF